MNVPLALLADYANVTKEGKLNVMGIFDRILAVSLPVRPPQMILVLTLEAEPAERGRDKDLEIQLLDADGKRMLSLTIRFRIPEEHPGLVSTMNHLVNIRDATFNTAGAYVFVILINGEPKNRVPFRVELLTKPT